MPPHYCCRLPRVLLLQRAGLGPLAREQLTEQQLETVVNDIQFHPAKVGHAARGAGILSMQ